MGPHFLAILTTRLLNISKNLKEFQIALSNYVLNYKNDITLSILLVKKKNAYTSTDVIVNQYAKNTPFGHILEKPYIQANNILQ